MDKRGLVAIITLAVLVRLVGLVALPAPPYDSSAEVAYLGGAEKLLKGQGFSDPSFPVYSPPLYAMFIAFVKAVFGDDDVFVRGAQIGLAAATVFVLYLIVREIFDRQSALLASGLLSVYPFSAYLDLSIASETLFTFLLCSFVGLLIHALKDERKLWYAIAGGVLGLATLARGTTQFMPLLVLVILLLVGSCRGRTIANYAAFLCCFLITILPWTLRNYVVLKDVIPVATAGGIMILLGSEESSLEIPGKPEIYRKYVPPEGAKASEIDKYFTQAGLANHQAHFWRDPVGFAGFMVRKFGRLWYSTETGRNHNLILGSNVGLYLLALVGTAVALKRRHLLAGIPVLVILYFAALHWVTVPLFRYMIPIMPFVIGLASYGVMVIGRHYLWRT